ncbi:hypothetical protein F5Y06DRAFT_276858 [Hypoxylon sp. FL0890]|nr:hypothetical protein F5Y06DRAFT_276858 [Hypoxylon sp. FL0890]
MATSSGPQGQSSSRAPSWANVVRNKSPEGKNGDGNAPTSTSAKPGKVAFKPKGGKNGSNQKNGQRLQQSRALHPSNSTRPPISTFRDQYLQQIQASEQPANQGPEPVNQPAVPAQDAQAVARLNTEVASLKAIIATLNDDLSRRSSDLIQTKTDLAVKNSEIENLKNRIAMLNDKLDSTTAANKENHAKFAAKDNVIKKLQYENASLRDAIHTGVISIAQVYGPGGAQAFTNLASKEADMIEQVTKGSTNGHRNVQMTKPSPNTSHALKQNGSSPLEQAPQPTRNSRPDEASKKTQKQSQQVREVVVPRESNRPAKVHSPGTKDHCADKDDTPAGGVHPIVEEDHPPATNHAAVEEVHQPVQANDSSSEQKADISSNADAKVDHNGTPAVKDSDVSAKEAVQVDDSPLPKASAPSVTQTQDIHVIGSDERGRDGNVSSPKVNDDVPMAKWQVDPTSGKCAFKGQESMDIVQGTRIDTSKSDYSACPQNNIEVLILRHTAAKDPSENNPSNHPVVQTDENDDKPMKNDDGWVNVSAKNRPKNKAKRKAKGKPKAAVTDDQNPVSKANGDIPKMTGTVPKEKGVPAKVQKRWVPKPNGTVIGSKSVFSQATNKQQNEQNAVKDKQEARTSPEGNPSGGKTQEKIIPPPRNGSNNCNSPPRNTNGGKKSHAGTSKAAGSKADSNRPTGKSWADEMEDADAKLQQTFQ